MEQIGNLKTLAERMKEKAEQERIETEKIFREQLQTLKDNLQASSQNALRTMSDAMAQEITSAAERLSGQYRVLSMSFGKRWIALTILGVALCLGMAIGGWALAEYGASNLEVYRSELARLKQDCQTQRRELEEMRPERAKAETWGLSFFESENGQFIMIPVGMEIKTGWTRGENQLIKLER